MTIETTPTTLNNPTTPDPFDPASLRINAAATPSIGVKKLLTSIPVRKPYKQAFVRVHPDETYRLTTAVLELKGDNSGETFLVAPSLHEALAGEALLVTLFLAIDRQGNPFLWPVKLAKDDARPNDWHTSALAAATEAMSSWVRVQANMSLGAYDVFVAEGNFADPVWPDMPLGALLKLAFRDRYIDSLDHPVIQKLKGRA